MQDRGGRERSMTMANILAVTIICAVLLGSSLSEARGSYQRYGSHQRGAGRDPEDRRISELEDMVNMLKRDNQDLKDKVTMLNGDVEELKEAADCPLAAFTAFIGPDGIVVPADDPIIFPLAANYGDVYSKATGIFTAPVDGIYSFEVSIRPFDIDPTSDFASVDIFKRGFDSSTPTGLIGRVTSSKDGQPFDVSSINTVFYLKAGCEVFIINSVNATFSTGTVFTGYLIKQVTLEGDV